MAALRGVVVGCGHMGTFHARKLAARADVELLGVVDPDPGRLEFARTTVDQPLDFAVVATPTAVHVETALPLLERGVPCIVEKPLGASAELARALAAYPHVSVNHVERYNPALAALPSGVRPRYLRAERIGVFHGRGTDVDVVLDLMIHDLDLVLHLAGGEITELRAVGVPVVTDGVDIAEAWIETSTGCVATLTASRVSRAPKRVLRVVAEEAYWSLDLGQRQVARVDWRAGELGAVAEAVEPADALECLHRDFLAAVRGEGPYPVPGREALAAVEAAERIAAAIAERR